MSHSFYKEQALALFGVFLGLGLVLSAWILANGLVAFRAYAGQQISVTGAASEAIQSDLATWSGTVTRQAASIADAFPKLQQDMRDVTAFLTAQGIPLAAIQPSSITTETLYAKDVHGQNTNQVEGYRLQQSFNLESSDVNLVERLTGASGALYAKGIEFNAGAPQYFYTKLDGLKVRMLGEAARNARERAASVVRKAGNELGGMRTARIGVFQITDPYSTEVSDSGILDTTSKRKKVTAVVNASFAIQ